MSVEVSTTSDVTAKPPEAVTTNGHARAAEASSYLQYLPAPFHEDAFVGQFLRVFESILAPIEQMVDMLPNYFDSRLTPDQMLPWLATWVGLELDENWHANRARALIASMAELYRWRGTRRGLRTHLELYTGKEPHVVESFDGLRVGQDGVLGGATAQLGERRAHSVYVTVFVDAKDREALQPEQQAEFILVRERTIRQIIEFQKPAHVIYQLAIEEVHESD
jgi:phage tail-like protein